MRILGFGGSNSSKSINRELVRFAASYFQEHEVEILDLNDYEMPIYKMDRERDNGIPQLAFDFARKIDGCDLLIVSLAENNGAYSAAFKNIFDWTSRVNMNVFQDKPMFLLATSPGPRGGSTVLEIAKNRFPFQGGIIKGSFSLPSYWENFDAEKGITNEELKNEFVKIVNSIEF